MPSNIPVKDAPSGRWTSRKRAALYLQRWASFSHRFYEDYLHFEE